MFEKERAESFSWSHRPRGGAGEEPFICYIIRKKKKRQGILKTPYYILIF